MGFRFDLDTANWLAFVVEPNVPIPPLSGTHEQFQKLQAFLESFSSRFYSSEGRESLVSHVVHGVLSDIREAGPENSKKIADAIESLRREFRQRLWTLLIVPSGDDPERDRFLCSPQLLEATVNSSSGSLGLVLQLNEPPARKLVLNSIFPAFQAALAESSRWPGALVWNHRAQATFFPFGDANQSGILERLRWITTKLGATPFPEDPNLFDIQELYKIAFPDARRGGTKLHIVQVSDIHLGCPEAGIRLPRLQQHLQSIVRELQDGNVVPIVSGDMMDSPSDRNLDAVRTFFNVLGGLGTTAPLAVLGNHDVRKDGWLQRILGRALQLPVTHGVHWYEESQVGIACFNSVVQGRLARGFVGERQRINIANEVDARKGREEFAIVGVLHHHPIPVETPDWLEQPFYERFIGEPFERTKALEDGDSFVQYAEALPMAALLHGHEHIPRIAETPVAKIPVFGCGSSVGKIKMKSAGETCISVNVITLDPARSHITGCVLVERVVGAGLSVFDRHAMVYRSRLDWRRNALTP